jgi:ArsR family transcriptional regulator
VQSSATDLDIRPLSQAFRALGDETRLRIVALLSHGELCVCHLEKALGISQPNASRQQNHAFVESQLGALTTMFGAERSLKADHARLRKSCGPNACK